MNVILKLDLYYRGKLLNNKMDYFCFPSEQVTAYVKGKNYLPHKKILPEFPIVYSSVKNQVPSGVVTIAIIGNIEVRRRNYDIVLKAFSEMVDALDAEVELLLLGRPIGYYGRSTIRRFKKLNRKHFKVTTFDSYIPQETFEAYVAKTHFLIIPAYEKTHYKLFKELYGYTKISGNINDMITYSKPAIIPSSYPLPEILKTVSETYEGRTELKQLLQKWIYNKDYRDFDFSRLYREYELGFVAKKTEKLLDDLTG
jgi:hypothetical protein